MGYKKFNNVFTEIELYIIKRSLFSAEEEVQSIYGRLTLCYFGLPQVLIKKVMNLCREVSEEDLVYDGSVMAVEYNNKYGKPNLPPHFDGDDNSMIFNFQIESNTKWPMGINTNVEELEDNSAIAFHPNENIHWRTHKEFNSGEYVKMLFIRFENAAGAKDYSHMALRLDDPAFDTARQLRDSL